VNADAAKEYRVYSLPLTEIATEITGRPISANIVAIGALAAASGKVSTAAFEAVIAKRVPKGTAEKNIAAFRAGYEALKKLI
jgi:Pyruvate/2-oxoacid:ferredoxin oxidoreductase gamma subunit